MTLQAEILGLSAAYALLGTLVLLGVARSRWPWALKAGTIVLTSAFYLLVFFRTQGLLGWSATAALPARFEVLWVRTVEPDPASNDPGAVHLWLEALDEGNRPNGEPRAYRLPYTRRLAQKVEAARTEIQAGHPQGGRAVDLGTAGNQGARRTTGERKGKPMRGPVLGWYSPPVLDFPTPAPELPAEPQQRQRKVIHIDMDAFYASVEQRDDPALRGKPVAVGGSRERGVVAAASYEARRFGVRSAMSGVTARRKCPELIFVRPRFDVYKAVSQQIRSVFAEHTPIIEPLSLDEAYLDVTENLQGIATATRIAKAIRASIHEQTGLTASAGVSYNKFLAKLASDHRKPDGLFVIPPDHGAAFVETLEVGRFHAVGPVTAAKMNRLGIHTGLDLRARSMAFLQEQFGKSGPYYYWIARGVDERAVRAHRIRKSVGAENTFSEDLTALAAMHEQLRPLAEKVWGHCERSGTRGRTVTLKVKYADFQQITRSRSFGDFVPSVAVLESTALDLLAPLLPVRLGVRLLGVTLSSLNTEETPANQQLTLAI